MKFETPPGVCNRNKRTWHGIHHAHGRLFGNHRSVRYYALSMKIRVRTAAAVILPIWGCEVDLNHPPCLPERGYRDRSAPARRREFALGGKRSLHGGHGGPDCCAVGKGSPGSKPAEISRCYRSVREADPATSAFTGVPSAEGGRAKAHEQRKSKNNFHNMLHLLLLHFPNTSVYTCCKNNSIFLKTIQFSQKQEK